MANVIKLKRGSGSDPSASDLVVGEVAIRTDSGKLFTKKDNGTIAEISGSGGGSDIFINTLSSSSGSGGGSATFNGTATRFTLSNPPAVSAQQLLVSINGVVQKPNSGTSPSEGFAIDGNDIIFAAAPATGSDFFIVTYGSLNIAVPADNSVTSAKIVDGTIVGTDLATNVDLVDNQKIRFGTGNDLHIFHDGFNSYIDDNGTGELQLRTINGSNINLIGGSDFLAKFIKDGAVELYHDGNKKFETKSFGVQVTGELYSDGLRAGDNEKLRLGDGEDLQIYHDGSHSRIVNGTNGGTLRLQTAGSEEGIVIRQNGAVELYYDNSKKFNTTATGATITGTCNMTSLNCTSSGSTGANFTVGGDLNVTGNIDVADNVKIKLGTGDDLQIYHDGSTSYIKDTGTGNLRLATSKGEFRNAADTENLAAFTENGGVELYYDHSKKLEVFTWGVEINGDLGLDDNRKVALGNLPDFDLFHDGSNSFIRNQTGQLQIQTNTFGVTDYGGNEYLMFAGVNGSAYLYYDGSNKVQTLSTGVRTNGDIQLPFVNNSTGLRNKLQWVTEANFFDEVGYIAMERTAVSSAPSDMVFATGTAGSVSERLKINSSGNVQIPNDSGKLQLGTSQDLEIYHDGAASFIENATGNLALRAKTAENSIVMIPDDKVALFYDNSKKLETTSNGIQMFGHIDLDDQNKLLIGDGNDLQIYHNGSHSYIQDSGTGTLRVQSSQMNVLKADGSETMATFVADAEVALFYNNSKKLETNSLGIGVGTSDTIIFNHSSSSDSNDNGVVLDGAGSIQVARHNDQCLLLNRQGTDGTIQTFYNDGTCVGFISVSGSTTSYSTNCSDRTLKKNFEDWTENTLSYFKNIKPQKFNFITEEDTVDKTKGYVAQDLVDNFPEAYPKNDEGKYVFNPSGMVVYLMKALQEAVARIEALEAK